MVRVLLEKYMYVGSKIGSMTHFQFFIDLNEIISSVFNFNKVILMRKMLKPSGYLSFRFTNYAILITIGLSEHGRGSNKAL